MAVTFFPFNSVMVNGAADRPANAESLAAYLAAFFSNGVLQQSETSLKVEPAGGMNVQVHAGAGCINGKAILNDAAEVITIEAASASQDRIDRVIFRLNEADRLMEFDVLKGTSGSSPEAPELTRTADIYELCLAEVNIPAGATEITASRITDTRIDTELCGHAQIPAHMQDIKHGGTGADNIADARQTINFIGKNPTSSLSDDTVKFWISKGTGLFFTDEYGQVTNQPTQYGMVLNLVENNHVFQIWFRQSTYGGMFRRAGDRASGWYTEDWMESLDRSNTVKTLKSGFTWASGKVTVPDSKKYTLFQICLDGQGTTILAARHTLGSKTYIRGISGYENDTPTDFTYHLGVEVNGEEWTLIGCSFIWHESGGIHSVRESCKITKIIGLI